MSESFSTPFRLLSESFLTLWWTCPATASLGDAVGFRPCAGRDPVTSRASAGTRESRPAGGGGEQILRSLRLLGGDLWCSAAAEASLRASTELVAIVSDAGRRAARRSLWAGLRWAETAAHGGNWGWKLLGMGVGVGSDGGRKVCVCVCVCVCVGGCACVRACLNENHT